MGYSLERLGEVIWINDMPYELPVTFDFSPVGFTDRKIIKLRRFDKKPLLDNLRAMELGLTITLVYSAEKDSLQRKTFVDALGTLWNLLKNEYPDGSASYSVSIGKDSCFGLVLCEDTPDNTRTLVCFGIKDGDSRGPDMAVILGLAKLEAREDIYKLFEKE